MAKRILIVDEEERLLYFLQVSLESQGKGYQVMTARSGGEALCALKGGPYHLLITASRMADMEGPELIREAKEKYPAIPAILMVDGDSAEWQHRARQLPLYSYFTKPFSVTNLLETAERALGDSGASEEELKSFSEERREAGVSSLLKRLADRRERTVPPEVAPAVVAPTVEEEKPISWEEVEPQEPLTAEVVTPLEEIPLAEEAPLVEEAYLEEMASEEGSAVEVPSLAEAAVGEEAPVQEEAILPGRAKPIPVISPERFEAISRILSDLRFEVGARCVILADIFGEVVTEVGVTADLDIATLVSLLAGGYATTLEMARQLGEEEALNLHYHEGRKYDIYSCNVGHSFLLVILFDREANPSKIGMVWLYAKRAIEELSRLLAKAEEMGSQEAFEDGFRASLRSGLDDLFGGGEGAASPMTDHAPIDLSEAQEMVSDDISEGGVVPPLARDDAPIDLSEAQARGLVSDEFFRLWGEDSGKEEGDAIRREP